MTLDIHNFDGQFAMAAQRLEAATISRRNRDLIRAYLDTCLTRSLFGRVRATRVSIALVNLARRLRKDFDRATRADLEGLVAGLCKGQFKPLTVSTYKKILRRFLIYVHAPDQFPNVEDVRHLSWLTGTVRKRELTPLKRSELLTEAEVEILLRHASGDRDRAFISLLWEAGPRVSEIGNMSVGDVRPATHGYHVDITGKTGTRSPLVVSSAPHLETWLAHHPCRNDPKAPLWIRHDKHEQLGYASIVSLLQRVFQRAGIQKPSRPHLFRHARVTHMLAHGVMNEGQCCIYFGWTIGTKIFATYSHLVDQDANNAVLRERQIAIDAPTTAPLTPRSCPTCRTLNAPQRDHCTKCDALLDPTKAIAETASKDELIWNALRLLVEAGLIDQAAVAVHQAGLGRVLHERVK